MKKFLKLFASLSMALSLVAVNVHASETVEVKNEEELLTAINKLGIGPMGLGGDTTALAVNVEYSNTATYIMPVAVNGNSWQ